MSQHVVTQDNKKWVFGWDPPLMSFYLQVHDMTLDEEENPIIWLGALPETSMYEVEDLVRAARMTGLIITQTTQTALYGEKDDGS